MYLARACAAWITIATAGLVMMAALMLAARPAHAFSEEAIGASARRSAATPVADPAESLTDPVSAAPVPSTTAVPRTPRATFPYAIRPGDSLGSIAAEFGLAVTDLTRLNHLTEETELDVGRVLRIPNPGVAHERELTADLARVTRDKEDADERARQATAELGSARSRLDDLTNSDQEIHRDLRYLTWWRAAAYLLGTAAFLMLGAMLMALAEWWILRHRFRAVAEMNESLRRLDYKYKGALAKAELRLQELYGRRRRGIHDGQERPKLAEEAEMESLNRELQTVLERHLQRLGPLGAGARRARSRERISGVGSPVEVRSGRR